MDVVAFKKEDWDYFCSKINFGKSNLDAKAIQIMNEPILLEVDELICIGCDSCGGTVFWNKENTKWKCADCGYSGNFPLKDPPEDLPRKVPPKGFKFD